jgi:hypothetical protein
MGDIIDLKGRNFPIDLTSDVGHQWVIDCCRAGEGIITDIELSEKWDLTDADWQAIRKDKTLERAIRTERERRVRTGQAVKETAAKHLVKGPGILDSIMSREDANPRHKIEAYKELRNTASVGADAEGRANSDRFIITINLGTDTDGKEVIEHYNKSIEVSPHDIKINMDDDHGKE